ncbi:MAG: hypothetical protein GY835_24185 [bacterium]|nr:hypothetical protein [bacterium]
MILSQLDINEFVEEYSDYQLEYGRSGTVSVAPDGKANQRFHEWLSNNPQVLMAAGFQEYVGAHKLYIYKRMVKERELENWKRAVFRQFHGQWVLPSSISADRAEPWEGFSLELLKEGRRLKRLGRLSDDRPRSQCDF